MKKIAFAGCAHIHTPSFVRVINECSANVTVAKVWDHAPARAEDNAKKLSAAVCQTPEEIANDPEIAGVIITSETNRHKELATMMAKAGKHIFVEKPLGFSADDAKELAKVIREAGVFFQTGYFMRGIPHYLFIKQLIEENAFGTITRIRHSNCHGGSIGGWFDDEWRWMADPAIAGCGAFGDLGTHSLDIIMWLMGRPDAVTASIHTVTGRYGADCDESGEALLEFPSGAVATFAGGWVDHCNPVSFEISGTNGHAAIIKDKLYLFGCGREDAKGEEWTQLPESLPSPLQRFIDRVLGNDGLLITADEAADRNIVMEAAYRSAREHKRVTIEY